MKLKFISIGMNHVVAANRIISIGPNNTATAQFYLNRAKDQGMFIDATRGRQVKSMIILDDGTVIYSISKPATLMGRINNDYTEMPVTRYNDEEDLLDINEEVDE